jgi:hypothetical protein
MMWSRVGIGVSLPGSLSCRVFPSESTDAKLTHVLVHFWSQPHTLFLVHGSTTTAMEPVVGISSPMAILFATFRTYSRIGREGWSTRCKEVGREEATVLFDNR